LGYRRRFQNTNTGFAGTIGGGSGNTGAVIRPFPPLASNGGGLEQHHRRRNQSHQTQTDTATIGGGAYNAIGEAADSGRFPAVTTTSPAKHATIAGGQANTVQGIKLYWRGKGNYMKPRQILLSAAALPTRLPLWVMRPSGIALRT
jgi:hypothetical protein